MLHQHISVAADIRVKLNSCHIDDLRHCLSHLLFENCRVIYEKVIKVLIHLPRLKGQVLKFSNTLIENSCQIMP